MIETEALIIGAGIIGCSTAYYLSKAGIDVTLVERDEIASGASSACDGFIFLQSKSPGIHLEMALESARLYRDLSSELGSELEYRRCGGMVVAEDEKQLLYLQDLVQRQKKAGLNVEVLSAKQSLARAPYLAQHILGASFCADDAQINPILVTFAFLDAARRHGTRILTQAAVQKVKIGEKDGRRLVDTIFTSREEIKPKFVVDAAGAAASEIVQLFNMDLPIAPRRGQILVTEPVSPVMSCLLTNAVYISSKLESDSGKRQCGVTFEQTESGNLLIGSTRESVGYNKRTTYEGLTTIARNAVKLIPRCAGFKVVRAFAGLRPRTPDGLCVLGALEEVENFYLASGHEGDGIALAPVTGKLLTELIVEGSTSINIGALSPNRFVPYSC